MFDVCITKLPVSAQARRAHRLLVNVERALAFGSCIAMSVKHCIQVGITGRDCLLACALSRQPPLSKTLGASGLHVVHNAASSQCEGHRSYETHSSFQPTSNTVEVRSAAVCSPCRACCRPHRRCTLQSSVVCAASVSRCVGQWRLTKS